MNANDSLALEDAAYQFGLRLESAGWIVGTAESCTGGLVAKVLTERSGSSAWFDHGVVTYTNESKRKRLGVTDQVLSQEGAVSEGCARQMALGLLQQLGLDEEKRPAIALSVTGIAGPTGAVPGKPVGTVCFGCALRAQYGDVRVEAVTRHFSGDRAAIRSQAALFALAFAEQLFTNLQAPGSGLLA
jgi:nicotinamide-nucleotide amidase